MQEKVDSATAEVAKSSITVTGQVNTDEASASVRMVCRETLGVSTNEVAVADVENEACLITLQANSDEAMAKDSKTPAPGVWAENWDEADADDAKEEVAVRTADADEAEAAVEEKDACLITLHENDPSAIAEDVKSTSLSWAGTVAGNPNPAFPKRLSDVPNSDKLVAKVAPYGRGKRLSAR